MAAVNVRAFTGGRRFGGAAAGAALVGFALFAWVASHDPRQAFFSYLTAFAFVVSIQLGALALLMISHLSDASWTVPIRRLVEVMASGLMIAPVLFLPVLLGMEHLYEWTHEVFEESPLPWLPGKGAYLSSRAFIARAALYFAVWIVLVALLRRWSLAGDRPAGNAPDPGFARTVSAAGLPPLGLTLTFAAFDWLMSLEPHWFSSMYGIYFFAGGFVAAIALVTVVAQRAEQSGWLIGLVSAAHYHALGRLLLAFTIFWAYVAFFQYFLIYIANRPEEVTFYVRRSTGSWWLYDGVLVLGRFALPFLILLLRGLKFRPAVLAAVAAWLVLAHYADVYWLVMPVLHPRGFGPHHADLAALLAVAGTAAVFSILLARGRAVAPANDPALVRGVGYRST
jgi:hypothetical protein